MIKKFLVLLVFLLPFYVVGQTTVGLRTKVLKTDSLYAYKLQTINSSTLMLVWDSTNSKVGLRRYAALGGTVTSVDATAGNGISVTGGPVTTTGTFVITNTKPDTTVILNSGTGITVSGTYPSFTITNSALGDSIFQRANDKVTLRNSNDSVGFGMTPNADFSLQGNVTYLPVTYDSTDFDDGISATEMQRIMIYSDTNSAWYDWTYGSGAEIANGTEGQLLTILSMSSGILYLRNNDTTNNVVFDMYGGDNITIKFVDNTWVEVGRVDFHPYSACTGGGGTGGGITYVGAVAGTGISITGSPITSSGTLNITNTAPDQTVVMNSGTGISVTGTYPTFTVTNTQPSSGGTLTGLVANSPLSVVNGTTTSTISIALATALASGYLSSTDWNTFNDKLSKTLADGKIFIGNSSNVATAQTISTDAAITNTGALTIANQAVTTVKLADNNVDGTKLYLTGNVQGSLMYFNGTDWVNLNPGTANQVLKTNGGSANPEWTTITQNAGTVTSFGFTNANGFTGNVTNETTTPNLTISLQDAVANGVTKGQSTYTATDFNSTTGLISLDYVNGQKASSSQAGFINRVGNITTDNIARLTGDTVGAVVGTGFQVGVDETKINHNNLLNYTARRHFTQTEIDTVNPANAGILKAAVTTGVLSAATAGVDYQAPITPAAVTVGSNKITLGGTPTTAALQAFSINADETKFDHNNLLNYTARRHFTQTVIDTVATGNEGILKASASGVLSPATAGTDYLITDKYWFQSGSGATYFNISPIATIGGKNLAYATFNRTILISRYGGWSLGAWPTLSLFVDGYSRFDSAITYKNIGAKATTPTYALVMDGDVIKTYAWPASSSFVDPSTTRGDLITRGGTDNLKRLGRGNTGQVLKVRGDTLYWANDETGAGGTLTWADTLAQLATDYDLDTLSFLRTEVDPVFAGDSAKILHWSDSIADIATKYDLDTLSFLRAEVDGDVSNELQNLTYDNRVVRIDGGGTDALIPRFSTTDTASGLVKGSANASADYFLNSQGDWAVPSGTGTGEANTASNVGSGLEIFKDKSGVDLRFRTLKNGFGSIANQTNDTIQLKVDTTYLQTKELTVSQLALKLDKSDTANQLRRFKMRTGVLIYGTGVGTWDTLHIGTNNQILTSNGTTPEWADAPAGTSHDAVTISPAHRGLEISNQVLTTTVATATDTGMVRPWYFNRWDSGYIYRVQSASGTSPLTLNLTNHALTGSILQASGSTNGYITSVNYNNWENKEPSLGNPVSTGYVLSSTTGGVRSWVAQTPVIDTTGLASKTYVTNRTNPKQDSVKNPWMYYSGRIIERDTTLSVAIGSKNPGYAKLNVSTSHTSGLKIGLLNSVVSSGAGSIYGLYSEITGSNSVNSGVAGYFSSNGLTSNIAISTGYGNNYFNSAGGNTGVGYSSGSTLDSLLSVNGGVSTVRGVKVGKRLKIGELITRANVPTQALADSAGLVVKYPWPTGASNDSLLWQRKASRNAMWTKYPDSVGINTVSPDRLFHVNGTGKFQDSVYVGDNYYITEKEGGLKTNGEVQARALTIAGLKYTGLAIFYNDIVIGPYDSAVQIDAAGNLQLGTLTAQPERLYVNGIIRTTDSTSIWKNNYEFRTLVALGDDVTLPFYNDVWGNGTISTDEGDTYAAFRFNSLGVVTLLTDCTTNVANTDTDNKLCIYDGGTNIIIKNRLGGSRTLLITITYSTYQAP